MKRKCPRTLDKPLLLFGLEMEDIALLGLIGGVGSIILGPMIPGVLAIAAWLVLRNFKKNKPSGYLLHYLYNRGLDFPGLIPPIIKAKRYGIYGTTDKVKTIRIS